MTGDMADIAATLATERMTLRPLRRSDAGPMSLYAGDRRVAEMLENVPHPYPPGAAAAFIARVLSGAMEERVWVMDATPSDGAEFIGVIGLRPAEPGIVRLGYWVGPPFWGAGYASEAAGAMVAALREAGVTLIEARVVAHNDASARVLENAGLRETGMAEFYSVVAGGMVPHRLFAADLSAPVADAPARA
jgi:RimJ/RimL family protein N-acetyltransferase